MPNQATSSVDANRQDPSGSGLISQKITPSSYPAQPYRKDTICSISVPAHACSYRKFVVISVDRHSSLTSLGTRALGSVQRRHLSTENGDAGLSSAQGLSTFPGYLGFLEVYILETFPIGEFGRGLIANPRAGLQTQALHLLQAA